MFICFVGIQFENQNRQKKIRRNLKDLIGEIFLDLERRISERER